MSKVRVDTNPKVLCRACGRAYHTGTGLQRCCSSSCEERLRQAVAKAYTAAKMRRTTKKAI